MKKDLLTSPCWTYKSIMEYIGCRKTKAYEIMSKVKRFYNGAIPNEPSFVTRDSVLAYLKTSVERELYVIEQINNSKERR